MGRYLLFYVDGERFSRHFDWTWIDKWISLYDVNPVIIDPNCDYREKPIPPYYFKRIEDAVAHPDLAKLTWIWTSEKSDIYWDTVEMPKDDVIYCTGSDAEGYHGYQGEGLHVQLRPPHPRYESGEDNPWYAAMVVPFLLFHVYGVVRTDI